MKYYGILIALSVVVLILGVSYVFNKPADLYSAATFSYSQNWRVQTDYGVQECEFSPENSIIAEFEITKKDDHFSIKCHKGPRYDFTNYYYFKFSNCSESDAALIDSAIRKKNDCFFPLNEPVPNSVNHYIAIVAQCLPEGKVPNGISCLPGKPKASVFYAVYDIDTGKLYY